MKNFYIEIDEKNPGSAILHSDMACPIVISGPSDREKVGESYTQPLHPKLGSFSDLDEAKKAVFTEYSIPYENITLCDTCPHSRTF